MLHRDPKPSNFVARNDGNLELVDFDTIGRGRYADDVELVRSMVTIDEGPEGLPVLNNDQAMAFVAATSGYAARIDSAAVAAAGHRAALRQAQRFLLDHLDGDRYYPAKVHGDNLALASRNLTGYHSLASGHTHRADNRLIVYLAAPNDDEGRLGQPARNRLQRFAALARQDPRARLALAGGFGPPFNRSEDPHYSHAFKHLKSRWPDIAERIEVCLPTSHSYHDVLMSSWYAGSTGSSEVTLVTSPYHQRRHYREAGDSV